MSRYGALREHGETLLGRGYPIVPIRHGTKHPGFKGWQHTQATLPTLKRWLANGFADGGVGVLTRDTPAADLDVLDEDVVHQLVQWCTKHIGATVQRVGLAPKTLLVYRTEAPFTKVTSRAYRDFLGDVHKVEVLGDGQQFVAFATHPDTGKPYQWVSDHTLADISHDDLPVITVDLARALVAYFESIVPEDWELASEGSVGATVDDNALSPDDQALLHAKPKLDLSNEHLARTVNRLDPDMRMADWVRVGMGLYHQFDGSDEGFAIWDDWSRQSEKHNSAEMRSRWNSFAPGKSQEPITAASILDMAKSSGGDTTGDPPDFDAPLDQYVQQCVYVQDGDRVCDLAKPPHCAVGRLTEFKNRTANIVHEVPSPTPRNPDRVRREPVWKAWLTHPDRRSAEGTVYDPKGARVVRDDFGLDWINEFHMPAFAETRDVHQLGVFHEHMEYLFPVKAERRWFTDWMAFNLQYPERRCKVTPLHVSIAHGTGRGWVVELLGKLLGQWNCTKTKMAVLAGESSGFQDYLHNSLLCAVEEVREGNKRFQVSDQIRDTLTEPYLEVNRKYGAQKTQPVYTNFFFMTNHPDALVLTEQDRRINVFSGPDAPRERSYYDRLYAWLDTPGVTQLYHCLMKRDLSAFDWTRSMATDARTKMVCNNRSETENLFWEMMEKPPFQAMTAKQISAELRGRSEGDDWDSGVDEGQLLKLLQHHAQGPFRTKIGGRDGKVYRVWQLTKGEKLKNQEIKESILKCGL